MRRQLLFFLIIGALLSSPLRLTAQESLIDSLQTRLQQDISSHQRIMIQSRLADVYSYQNISRAQQLNQQAIHLAQKKNDTTGLAYSWAHQTGIESKSNRDSLAIEAAKTALFYGEQASPLMYGYALYIKGNLENYANNNHDEAIKIWHQALGYLQRPEGALYQAGIYYQLYGIYAERKDYETAKQYAELALKRALQSGNYNMIAACWQIVGSMHLDAYWASEQQAQLDSAVTAYQNSVNVYRQHHAWMKYPPVVVLSAINLANIYAEYYPLSYMDSVEKNLNLALKVSLEGEAEVSQINTYQAISRLYRKTGEPEKAEQFLENARVLVDSLEPMNYYAAKNIYRLLAELNEKQGDYKKALTYQNTFFNYYKHIFNQERDQTLQRLETKYQTAKKEEALLRLKERNAFQKKKTTLYIVIAVIAIISLLALFLAYRFKLKFARQREKSKAEEAARLKTEHELTLAQKENLQKELMAGALQVEHKNELLQNLKQRLAEKSGGVPAKQLDRIIKDELRIDDNFEDIRKELNELHPEFFNRLQVQAEKKLTQLDLKYCAYLYMKLSTKQIAELMHVAPKSVRMAKYRLKQKLNLGKEDDLIAFLLTKGTH